MDVPLQNNGFPWIEKCHSTLLCKISNFSIHAAATFLDTTNILYINQDKIALSLVLQQQQKLQKTTNAQKVEYIDKYWIEKTFCWIFFWKDPAPQAIILAGWKSAN